MGGMGEYFYKTRFPLLILTGWTLCLGSTAGSGLAATENPPSSRLSEELPFLTLKNNIGQETTFGWDEKLFQSLWLPKIDSSRSLSLKNIGYYSDLLVTTQPMTYTSIVSLKGRIGSDDWSDSGVRGLDSDVFESEWGDTKDRYKTHVPHRFTVIPEPFGAAFFLLGALVFAIRKSFRSKA